MNVAIHVVALSAFAASCAPSLVQESREHLFYEMQVTAPGTRSQGIRGRLFDADGQSVVTNASGDIVREESLPAGTGGASLMLGAGIFLHRARQHAWDISGMIPETMLAAPHLNDPSLHSATRFRLLVRGMCASHESWRGELLDSHGTPIGPSTSSMDTPMGRFTFRSGPQEAGWFPETWPENTSLRGSWPCITG